jgi:hypothetical protein
MGYGSFFVSKMNELMEIGGYLIRMKRAFNVIIEKDSEGFYVASVPALQGCHMQAQPLERSACTCRINLVFFDLKDSVRF